MVRKEVLGVALLFVVCFAVVVSGLQVIKTPISVKAGQYNNLTIKISNEGSVIKVVNDYANQDGDFSFEYSSLIDEFSIILEVKDVEGVDIGSESYGPFPVGSPVSIVYGVANGGSEPESDVSSNESGNSTNQSAVVGDVVSQDGTVITGMAVSGGDGGNISDTVYYIVGGILLVGALVFFFIRRSSKKVEIKSKPYFVDRMESIKRDVSDASSPELMESQKRIRALQREISSLKNQDKIREMQEHIRKEQEEVERLSRGEL
jgi:hypothetical protein